MFDVEDGQLISEVVKGKYKLETQDQNAIKIKTKWP